MWDWSVAKPAAGLVFSQGLVQVICTILCGDFCDQSEILCEQQASFSVKIFDRLESVVMALIVLPLMLFAFVSGVVVSVLSLVCRGEWLQREIKTMHCAS